MRKIMLTNSMTGKKEEFLPQQPPLVKMYCCGPTVYDFLHVGNFRGPIFYSFLRRFLKAEGYQVQMVFNYTDVDDKIINRALAEGRDSRELSENFIREFEVDFNRLKLEPAQVNPKVTETMPEILQMIEELIKKGKAYATASGDVWYQIDQFENYGCLSHRKVDELLESVRVEAEEGKKSPLDFALWKSAKKDEPSWSSPWGEGRPGWHIECSAMVRKHLGDTIDIHGGGLDLLFPHHENEIAQSEGCSGQKMVRYWVHHNLINFGGAKMSKSLGNIQRARDFMDEHHPELLKYMMLSVHYRSVLDLSEEAVNLARKGLARIYSALALAETVIAQNGGAAATTAAEFANNIAETREQMLNDFADDFNTALAMSRIFDLTRIFNSLVVPGQKVTEKTFGVSVAYRKFVQEMGQLFSLFAEPAQDFLRELDRKTLPSLGVTESQINAWIAERKEARAQKNFARADELRKTLTDKGIVLRDLVSGETAWETLK